MVLEVGGGEVERVSQSRTAGRKKLVDD